MPESLSLISERIIRPARGLMGSLRMPGDKSISHRYALLAAMAQGVSRLHNFSSGADCASSLECMRQLGARITRTAGDVEIAGCDGTLSSPDSVLDCGNSGSTMRMLCGLLAPQSGVFTLSGDRSLNARPMERVRKPLVEMGARISLTGGHAPITIQGAPLKGISYATPIPSAQVKTAVLFAALQAEGTTTLRESVRTRDHGELALKAFGAKLQRSGDSIEIAGGQQLHALEAAIPGDLSSAAFFLCAAALFPGSSLTLDQVGMNPTRASLLDLLSSFGLKIGVLSLEETCGELAGTLQISPRSGDLSGGEISGSMAAQLIDELPVLAAIAPYTRDGIRIRDAKELRVKESDRIALVARNLRAMGAQVEEFEDGLSVSGGQRLHGGEIDSGDDHRIAMAFSIAALRAEGDTLIRGADAAAISFPEFYDFLERVAER